MSKAKEMFEALGNESGSKCVITRNDSWHLNYKWNYYGDGDIYIEFEKRKKNVVVYYQSDDKDYPEKCLCALSPRLIEAMHQQTIELGWIDG